MTAIVSVFNRKLAIFSGALLLFVAALPRSASAQTVAKTEGENAGEVRDDSGLKMKLVWCPKGTFTMGSPDSDKDAEDDEKPAVLVTLTRGFWLGKSEVTQREWERVMGATPWKGQDYVREEADYAATYVSWEDASEFCKKLTDAERAAVRLPKNWEYTLPTEAQWEYACRAGSTSRYSFGDDGSKLGDYAWWGGILGDGNIKDEQYAHRVGQKKPNGWGLHDMHGNVSEWCRDWYKETLTGGSDPEEASGDSLRVNRGGSWPYGASGCRSAGFRRGYKPSARIYFLGFRVALSSVR